MFRNSLLRNISAAWFNLLVLTIVNFFLTPFLIQRLGDTDYGIWVLIISTIGYLEMMNLGINTAVIRFISKYHEKKEHAKINEIFNSALTLFTILAVGVAVATAILSVLVPQIFNLDDRPLYKILVLIVGLDLAFAFVTYTFSAVIWGRQRIFVTHFLGTGTFLIRTACIVYALLHGYGLLALAVIQIATNVIRGISAIIYALKISPYITLRWRFVTKSAFKDIFSYTFFNLIINLAVKINSTASLLLIGYFLGPAAITSFAIAENLLKYLYNFLLRSQKVMIPRFSQLDAQQKPEKVRENFLFFTRFSQIVAIPVLITLLLYGEAFIGLWVGEKYMETSGTILTILCIGALVYLPQLTTTALMKGISQHKGLAYLRILESASIVVVGIVLIQTNGLIGIALANTIPRLIFNLIVIPVFACKLLEISRVHYYVKCFLRVLLPAAPLFFAAYLVNLDIHSYMGILAILLALYCVFFILVYLVVFDSQDRRLVWQVLRR